MSGSLAGQGQFQDAARCFIAATQANVADPRAFRLLQDLLKEHPELEFEFKDAAECCQKAVEVAGRRAEDIKPKVYRGWQKHFILLWARLRGWFR